jgi:hypothetical protein
MRTYLASFLTVCALGGVASAQAKIVATDAPKAAEDKDIQGWNPYMSLTSTFSLVDNSSVIGQVDGTTTLFGIGVLGGADYIHGKNLLQLNLSLNEGFTRTPVIDRFVKTTDQIKIEGLYNYFLDKYFGVYGRLAVETNAFQTKDVRGTPTSWVESVNGTSMPLATNALSQKLAGPFAPFTVTESIGGFADPVRKDAINVSFRLGAGGRHTFADGVLVNHDDAATPEIELLELSTVHQLGVEGFAGAMGKVQKGKLDYKAGLAVLIPFVNNDNASRSAISLTRVALEANASYTMSSWLSVVYHLAVTRDPQLFPAGKDEIQVQNTLLLTFQFSLVKKKEKAKEPTKEEAELAEAKRRADEAEKRATDAEQKLLKLEAAPTTTPPAPSTMPPPASTAPNPAAPTP